MKFILRHWKIISGLLIVMSISIILGAQIPVWYKQYKINKLTAAIETFRESEQENKKIREELKQRMDDVHAQNEQIRSIIDEKQKQLCEIDGMYCIDKKQEYKRSYENIIIHHTATDIVSIADMKQSMLRRFGSYPSHYVIGKHGDREKITPLYERAGGTKNEAYNRNSIQIEVIGDFTKHEPTQEQYNAILYLIKEIKKKYGNMNVIKHSQVS